MALVLDASIMLNWYFEDEGEEVESLIMDLSRKNAVVPAHWAAEVANGVLIGERRGRSMPGQVAGLHALLDNFQIEVDAEGNEEALGRILPLARAHRLTVYDALYLELAERRGLPLATLDGELAAAARSVGIEVLGAEGEA
jgi:predicted nucleic acid-binding protein